MKKNKNLPLFGVGPIYGFFVIMPTVAAIFMRNLNIFTSGRLLKPKVFLIILGIILILLSVFMWVQAVIVEKLDDNIKKNHLVTSGIYAWVRNPIYSSILLLCTGLLFIVGNTWFFILPFVYWTFLTLLMKNTEEKWLRDWYGKEYEDYLKRVNRCLPFPPIKTKNAHR